MKKLRVLELSGTHYDMGYQHGLAYKDDIIAFTEERIELSRDPNWSGPGVSTRDVLALAEACVDFHQQYAPDLMDELRGTADATGLSMVDLVVVNGFTDFVDVVAAANDVATKMPAPHTADNCTAFIVPNSAAADGRGFFGQTWDMHDSATPYVILLKGSPRGKPAFIAFTITGCVGMIGMNDAGIAVGINNLTAADGRPGVTWPFVVRKALEQTNIADALACITDAPLAGAHNYLLADSHGHGYNIEAMATYHEITEVRDHSVVHTNHCTHPRTLSLERPRLPDSQASSEGRLNRARELLEHGSITLDDLIALTRDQNGIGNICVIPEAPKFVATCGAAIMRPQTREFWAVWGLPTESDYERFTIG